MLATPSGLADAWRRTFVITSVIALYFNSFILVVQLFEKVPALKAMAPTQSGSPFKIAQLATLLLFVVLGVLSARASAPHRSARLKQHRRHHSPGIPRSIAF